MAQNPYQYNENAQTAVAYDEGLRKHFANVYNTMFLGMLITGLTSFVASSIPAVAQMLYATPLGFVVMFAPLAFIFIGFSHKAVRRDSVAKLRTKFYAFSGVMGLSMGYIFLAYVGADIARAFFITAGTFAAMSIVGYTTKKDLSSMGGFILMGLIGVIIASIVNMFIGSDQFSMILSYIVVLLMVGLTAYETQQIKEIYNENQAQDANAKAALMGALSLYITFINMFQAILHIIGNRNS